MEDFTEKLSGFTQIHYENYKDIDTGICIKYISDENDPFAQRSTTIK